MANWFTVDKQGLAKVLERRGKDFVVLELLSNALDENTKLIDIQLRAVPGKSLAELQITDDSPEGFQDLKHAWTLFAESYKKSDAKARGRFDLGEKYVLALCEEAEIASTTGTVVFDRDGRHEYPRRKREVGTQFRATVRMSHKETADACSRVQTCLLPKGKEVCLNFIPIPVRKPTLTFDAVLLTEIGDSGGYLRRSKRKTEVEIHETIADEVAQLYELGIPICPLDGGENFHVNVMQRIPLSTDRDSVPISYLQDLRALCLNRLRDGLSMQDVSTVWVQGAIEDDLCDPESVDRVRTIRFGEKSVILNPSDPEANARSVAAGYTLIPPATFSRAAWGKIKAHGRIQVSSDVTPAHSLETGPNGKQIQYIESAEYTTASRWCQRVGSALLSREITVRVCCEISIPYGGFYTAGTQTMTLNVGRLGKAWFVGDNRQGWLELLLHEASHQAQKNHLLDAFTDEVARLGAEATILALSMPELFQLRGVR